MGKNRKISLIVAILFILATVSYFSGSQLLESAIKSATNYNNLASTRIQWGVFWEFINGLCVISIAVLLHPLLKRYQSKVATGYLASRIIEATMLLVASVGPLLLASQGGAQSPSFSFFREIVLDWHDLTFQMGMLALSLGSLLLCTFLFMRKSLPKYLAILGIIGYIALFISGWLAIFLPHSGLENWLYVPGGIFEIVFPIWLIIKGFPEELQEETSIA